jgi:L-ascorbate metabolism protein UlaG (beta-lactamase superfamily)
MGLRRSLRFRILVFMADSADVLPAFTGNQPTVEHFRDGRFFNPGVVDHNFRTALRWMTHRNIGPWRRWIESTPGPAPPALVDGGDLRATFVNHATVLLQVGGINILTDPVWSRRVSPVQFAGPARHRAPGIRFEDLPAIHVLLISHNHYDHFDVPTLKRIAVAHRPAVFCPLGLEAPLRRLGFRDVHELDWWESRPGAGTHVHCVQAQHFSARTPFDRNRTLWCGWLLETDHGNIYFAGDTGFGGFFASIRDRFPSIRLALLPIGAFEPEWFMGPVHMSPEQAVEARGILGAATAIGIHFGTFSLADDGETAPTDRLHRALEQREDGDRFWTLREGEGRLVP